MKFIQNKQEQTNNLSEKLFGFLLLYNSKIAEIKEKLHVADSE